MSNKDFSEETIIKLSKKIQQNKSENNAYIKQLDRFFNGTMPTNEIINVCSTPNILKLFNSTAKKVVLSQKDLKNAIADNKSKITGHVEGHEIPKEEIYKLSEAIRNPIMLIRGNKRNVNSVVMLTELVNKKGENIFVPIALDRQNGKISNISTLYGKKNLSNYLNANINNILAINIKKADMLADRGVQFSKSIYDTVNCYDDSISYTIENVKYPTKERSEIMQEKIKENINFPEIIAHDEFIKATPVKDVNQLGWSEKNIKELSEKTPTKYTTHHIQNNLNQELDKNKAYEIPQNNIINIENSLSSNSDIINMLTQMAEQNDNHAKIQLALAYYFGEYGLEKNGDKAVELLGEAAGEGSAVAQRDLAIILENTEPKDQQKAIEYYKMAVDNENPDAYALNNLGVCYLTGDGVEVDYKKAVELFKKAAELGDDYAKLNLADNYYLGIGTRQSFEKAFELYKEVAENGNVTALKYLGECYESGKGTEVNYKLALECYQKAIEKGDEDAKYKYAELSNKISPHKHTYVDNSLKQTIQKQQEQTEQKQQENVENQQEQAENKTEKQL